MEQNPPHVPHLISATFFDPDPPIALKKPIQCQKVWLFPNFMYIIYQFQSATAQLEQKISGLVELASRRPVIKMNGDKFRQYVKSSPRNYSTVLMLTALAPQRQCGICK